MARGRARRPDARHVTRPETGAGDTQRVHQDVAEVTLPPRTRELLRTNSAGTSPPATPPPHPAGPRSGGRPRRDPPPPPLPPRTRELLQFKLKSRYRGGDGGCLDASKVLKLLAFDLA